MSTHVEWFDAAQVSVSIEQKPGGLVDSHRFRNRQPVLVLGGGGGVAAFEGSIEEIEALGQQIIDVAKAAR